ncbi:MAG TPA: aldehyde dehydrogenase family protein [Polyangiaceae bacterium]|nr:aldehyde dehydrogenase family protein [Polyangiaceae bacterium]
MVASQSEVLGPSAGPMDVRAFAAKPPTERARLDALLSRLADEAQPFARLPIGQKIALLREVQRRTHAQSADWVAAACRAKGISMDEPLAGEEWIAGPAVTLRNIRLLLRSLEEIEQKGVPVIDPKRMRDLAHGATAIRVAPFDAYDAALYGGLSAETWLLPGVRRGDVAGHQASFYKQKVPEGGVSLVLGAGNVASIPPMDVLYKMFVDGHVCILKMNPVNEYLGPFFEKIFEPLMAKGYVAIVYGGGDVGAYLCEHPAVSDIHITGSDKTHDLIVWGPPGPPREERKRRNDPLLKKPITSELGNVSPVLIVPGPYTDDELASMAQNVAGMICNNASFNCNAAKMLVVPKGWAKREQFVRLLSSVLAGVPPRKAYYPGARQRYDALTTGHADVRKIGPGSEHVLPWTLVLGLDAASAAEPNFTNEPFCSILSEVAIGSTDPLEFLAEAVPFANDHLWGTLSAMLFAHPTLEADAAGRQALDTALAGLRYGTVGVNVWPALGYALCTTPWGGHPSATLTDIQSGLGWVHDTLMLEDIEKCVIRGPLKPVPKHVYFPGHRGAHRLGRRLVEFEAAPSWLKVPGLAAAALTG